MPRVEQVTIGGREIGPEQPALLVAELSANHNGDLDLACRTIEAAAAAGADAVKFQTYTADSLTLDCDSPDFVVDTGTPWDGRKLWDLYQEAHTPRAWHPRLFEVARGCGLLAFSSPFDASAVAFLDAFEPPAWKIASFEITDLALIREVARRGRPVLISTGIATDEDIERALVACREVGNEQVVLLQCTSAYPAPASEANLRRIPELRARHGVPSGLSDHTLGRTVAVAARALGACVIEKHFILERAAGGPDSAFSLEPDELTALVRDVRQVEAALGTTDDALSPARLRARKYARSLYVARDIKAGEVFTAENVRSVRPGLGLHPRHLPELLGRRATRDLQRGTRMALEFLAPGEDPPGVAPEGASP